MFRSNEIHWQSKKEQYFFKLIRQFQDSIEGWVVNAIVINVLSVFQSRLTDHGIYLCRPKTIAIFYHLIELLLPLSLLLLLLLLFILLFIYLIFLFYQLLIATYELSSQTQRVAFLNLGVCIIEEIEVSRWSSLRIASTKKSWRSIWCSPVQFEENRVYVVLVFPRLCRKSCSQQGRIYS